METQRDAACPLTQYELRLLRCTLGGAPPSPSSPHHHHRRPQQQQQRASPHLRCLREAVGIAVEHAERGEYAQGLCGEPGRVLFQGLLLEEEGVGRAAEAEEFYQRVAACVSSFLRTTGFEGEDGDGAEVARVRALLVMAVGVLSLLAFVQANITGPVVAHGCPHCPVISNQDGNSISEKNWNLCAEKQLMIDGCDLSGKCAIPQYLVLARLLLVDIATDAHSNNDGFISIQSWDWWAFRTLLIHQRVLTERSPSLYDSLKHLSLKTLKQFGDMLYLLESPAESAIFSEESSMIATAMQLEVGLMEYTYGHADRARKHFKSAEDACGLQLSMIGMFGYRTVHQVEPKPQMVLVSKQVAKFYETPPSEEKLNPNLIAKLDILEGQKENIPNFAGSDVLLFPRLVGDAQGGGPYGTDKDRKTVLSSIQQALVLGYCLDVKQSGPDDELKGWQMAPFIESVDAQEYSDFMVNCCCQLLRIRWEQGRSRTRERAYLMMEQLVEKIRGTSVKMANRMCFVFCVAFPSASSLLREYAELMMSCGLVGEALGLFKELELWDNLIDCYCLLGKKGAAVNLIQERLKHQPSDPRLWCSLGDVTVDDKCYINAWEASNHRFARAQRSLGRSAYNRGDYERSTYHWSIALSINPLYPGGWFAFGSAALKERDLDKAIAAFTRAVQIDPENGEAWNNIAAIHMTEKRSKEAFIAFREALKYRRDSWQLWENYARVALDIQNLSQVVMALQMVLKLSQGQHIDLNSVAKLVEQIEMRKVLSESQSQLMGMKHQVDIKDQKKSGSDIELGAEAQFSVEGNKTFQIDEIEQLIEMIGHLLKQIISTHRASGDIWGLLARWHKMKGDMIMASEALLKQVRAYQGLDWQHNQESFQKFAQVSLDLCENYLKTASANGGKRELYTARMHLNNTMKQGKHFVDHCKYKELEDCLLKVEAILQGL